MNLKNKLRMSFFFIAILTLAYILFTYFYIGRDGYDLGQAILVCLPQNGG